jgi:hypothetical protein
MRLFSIPTKIVFFHKNHQVSYFRIKFSFDGKISLLETKQEPKPNQSVLYVLDIELVFKRSSAIHQSQLKNKQQYLSVAEGLFPFASDNAFYAMNSFNHHSYFFAIEKHQLDNIISHRSGKKRAVLISPNNNDALLQVVQKWLKRTPFLDLQDMPLSAHFFKLVSGAYIFATTFFISLLLFFTISFYQAHLETLDSQFIALEKKAQPLYTKQNVTRLMQHSYQGLQAFSQNCSIYSLSALGHLISKTPEKSELSHIQFNSNQLTIKGKTKDFNNWFGHSTLFKNKKIDSSPEFDYFTLTIDCKDLLQPENRTPSSEESLTSPL